MNKRINKRKEKLVRVSKRFKESSVGYQNIFSADEKSVIRTPLILFYLFLAMIGILFLISFSG